MTPQRRLGTSGPLVSAVGIGCNNLGRPGVATEGQQGTTAVVLAALDSGVTFFDCADIYGATPGLSETLLGEALRGRRDEAFVATKWGYDGVDVGIDPALPKGSPEYIRQASTASLERLQVDTIDLYQQHSPDPSVPIAETVDAVAALIAEGTVRWFGVSNFTPAQLREVATAAEAAGVPLVSTQDQYSLLERDAEAELFPTARELGLGALPYYPLANGLLTGRYRRDVIPEDSRIARVKPQLVDSTNWDQLEAYAELCAAAGVTELQATFAATLAQEPVACVIAGATRPHQVQANAEAASTVLAPETLAAIRELFAA